MTNYTIKVQTGHYFISPFGFVSYSEDFLNACNSHVTSRPFSPAEYYLACRSLELSLKAFLLLKGVSRDNLKKRSLWHDLHKILKKCKDLGIRSYVTITNTQESDIDELNKWYSRKGFEYFEIENLVANRMSLPDISSVKELALTLISGLKGPCKDAANKP